MLALGIGLTVAMVCTVDGVLLRGLPVPDGERLVAVVADNPAQRVARAQLTVAEAEQLVAGTPGFESLGYFQWTGVNVLDGGHAREIPAQFVGTGFFASLGAAPLLDACRATPTCAPACRWRCSRTRNGSAPSAAIRR